jgi:valyl-tRNA synthetase
MWDILFFWVARMIMMGLYTTDEIPFEVAHMHSRVLDGMGQKMSKSKGNTINPVDIAEKYGADALRMALVIGVAPGSDIALSEDKIRAQRNFVNKIWNATRFVSMMVEKAKSEGVDIKIMCGSVTEDMNEDDKEILKKLSSIITSTNKNMEGFRFGQASEDLYHFFWHEYCDNYIEKTKDRFGESAPVHGKVLLDSLKLLHPFIPFVTEQAYGQLKLDYDLSDEMLAGTKWPEQI